MSRDIVLWFVYGGRDVMMEGRQEKATAMQQRKKARQQPGTFACRIRVKRVAAACVQPRP